jgi:site-specific DNA-methyltransferase (adenine-specific)
MQKRSRDTRNKSVYARSESGEIINGGKKKGVPLSDVWEIPFLNPKAKERVGYPTQKPVILMNQIIKLVTDEGDVVLDPFCGSGTTLLSAQLLNRRSIGIDVSEEAIELTKSRLENPIVTSSALLEKGADSYRQHASEASNHLTGINYVPVHRNKGIDGLLADEIDELPAFIRVQREVETLQETVSLLQKATKNKGECKLVVVVTRDGVLRQNYPDNIFFIQSVASSLSSILAKTSGQLKRA